MVDPKVVQRPPLPTKPESRLSLGRTLTLAILLIVVPVAARAVTIPNLLINGTVADAEDVNQNFDALANSINLHEPDPDAHHMKTVDAGELAFGTLPDARLSANVSFFGSLVDETELEFDPATQAELDGQIAIFNLHALDASAHHLRYSDAEAIAAVGPHVTSVDGLAGGTVSGDVEVDGLVASTIGGFRFPDDSVQTTAFNPGNSAILPNRLLVAPSGGDFTSIQAAIDSIAPDPTEIEPPWSGTWDPWLIDIAPGIYEENLTIRRSGIHLRGAGVGATVLVPVSDPHVRITNRIPDPPSPVSTILEDTVSVELSQLTLYDDPSVGNQLSRGIEGESSHVTLREVRIEGYDVAQVFLEEDSRLDARDVVFATGFQTLHAIELVDSDAHVLRSSMNVEDCAVRIERGRLEIRDSVLSTIATADDVCATDVSGVVLTDNRLDKGVRVTTGQDLQAIGNEIGAALVVTDVDSTRVVGNWIGASAGASEGPVIEVSGGHAEITGNTIWGGSPRTIRIGDHATLTGNWIEGTPGSVVVTNEGIGSIVANTIVGGAVGIRDEGQARIVGNLIDGATQGIDLSSATGPTQLIGNEIRNSTGPEPAARWSADRTIRIEVEDAAGGVVGALTVDPNVGASVTSGGSTLTLLASGDVSLSAAGNLTLSGNDVTLSATGALRLDASRIEGHSSSDVVVSAGTTIGLDATGEVDVTSSATVDVNGALITLN